LKQFGAGDILLKLSLMSGAEHESLRLDKKFWKKF